jgi:hypothetical protein
VSHKALFVSNVSDVLVPTIVSLDVGSFLPQSWDVLGSVHCKKMAVIPGIVLSAGTLIFSSRRQNVDSWEPQV